MVSNDILTGMKAISQYLGVSESTARSYKEQYGLPIEQREGIYFSSREVLDEWNRRRLRRDPIEALEETRGLLSKKHCQAKKNTN